MLQSTYTVAVVGSTGKGDYGHDLDQAWQHVPATKLVGLADDNPEGLAAALKRVGEVPGFADYRQMLDQVKPQILCIASRWLDRHFEMCQAAFERGIHVYIEKPLCQSLEQADTLMALAERNHALLTMALPTRYSPKLSKLKELLQSGNPLGPVWEFRGRGKEDQRGGGEDLWVLGTHILDLFRYLGGDPLWCFASVTQDGKPIQQSDARPGNEGLGPLCGDAVHACFGLPNGQLAHFSSVRKGATSPSKYGLQIFCKQGVAEILEGPMPPVHVLVDKAWSPARGKGSWKPVSSQGIDQPETLTEPKYQQRHTLAILDLLAAIEERRQPLSNLHEARAVVEMISAIFESALKKTSVSFPLVNRAHPLG